MRKELKRIAIIGLPGSGKSTFALNLGKTLGIHVYHLDKYVFNGALKRDRQEFLTAKYALVNQESWIIEGCSISTLEMRFTRADTVIYFRFSRWLCLWRIIKRVFTFNESIADTGCLKGVNWALLKYMWNFERNHQENIEKFRKCYPHVEFLVFRQWKDSNTYLEKLEK